MTAHVCFHPGVHSAPALSNSVDALQKSGSTLIFGTLRRNSCPLLSMMPNVFDAL